MAKANPKKSGKSSRPTAAKAASGRSGSAAPRPKPLWYRAARHLAVVAGAVLLTMLCFLVLPLIQSITEPPAQDTEIREVGVVQPPPPPPPEQEEPPEPEEEKPEPELEPEQKPLDLDQLDIALNAGTGGGLGGQLSFDIGSATESDGGTDALFNLGDLDQRPRPVYRKMPNYTQDMRRNAPGEVVIIFIVNKDGRVEEAKVQRSSHPAFERAALAAIKQWKFEPGKRDGEPVRFRMKQPFKFPKT